MRRSSDDDSALRAKRRSAARRRPKLRVLVTAGPTREFIDTVRYISNASSGRMGFAIAQAFRRRGHRVTLIHGPVAVRPPADVRAVAVVSAAEMLAACRRAWPRHDVLVMTAAVADYAPRRVLRHKLKKGTGGANLALRPTADILARLSARRHRRQVVIGFALEDRDAQSYAEAKLAGKRLDAIVLNSPANIGGVRGRVEVLVRNAGWTAPRATTKRGIAAWLARLAELLAGEKAAPRLTSRPMTAGAGRTRAAPRRTARPSRRRLRPRGD
ncbi:MAG: hypothetical protein CHACPFDD_03320 [Phycisphaerae bacterium]|nr:hypothetical protein [Phycisphaerae bacterium]